MATIYFAFGPPLIRWELGSVRVRWVVDDTIYWSGEGRIP